MTMTAGAEMRDAEILMPGVVSGLGGASQLMLDLAKSFERRGRRAGILVPAFDSARDFADRCRREGISAATTPWLVPRDARLAGFADASRFVLRFRAPVVHYHLSDNVPVYMLLHAMNALSPPRAFATVHSPYEEPAVGSVIARRWAAAAPRHFHKVITVSGRARRLQLDYGLPESLVEHIPNGVDTRRARAGDGSRAREILGVEPFVPIVTTVGRLVPQKRPVDAVAAFAAIAREWPDAQLVIVGTGELETAVRASAADAGLSARVHLVGHRDDVPDWLAATSIWLLPSESEGMSVALLEALAAGCPVVSTAAPGNDEVLHHGDNALLAPVGDVGALAECMRQILRDPRLRDRLVRRGRATAEEYSLERMCDRYLACYDAAGVQFGAASRRHA